MVPDTAGRGGPSALRPHGARRPARDGRKPRPCYFLLRRWIRVFFSSLRCFFLAIRLRRFLITEPIVVTSPVPPGQAGTRHCFGPPQGCGELLTWREPTVRRTRP